MVDLQRELTGPFFIEFVGDSQPRRIVIKDFVQTREGRPIYLIGEDGTKYNWTTIIRMKRA